MRPLTCFLLGALLPAVVLWGADSAREVAGRREFSRTAFLPAQEQRLMAAGRPDRPGEAAAEGVWTAPASMPLVLWSARHWELLLYLSPGERRLQGQDWPQPHWGEAVPQGDLRFTGGRGDTIAPLLRARPRMVPYQEWAALTCRGAAACEALSGKGFGVCTRNGFVSF